MTSTKIQRAQPLNRDDLATLGYLAARGSRQGHRAQNRMIGLGNEHLIKDTYDPFQDRSVLTHDEPMLDAHVEPDDALSVSALANLDPADHVAVRIGAGEPRDTAYPNVTVGRLFLDRLAIAEKALALKARGLKYASICARLEVEFGLTHDEVRAALVYMGVDDELQYKPAVVGSIHRGADEKPKPKPKPRWVSILPDHVRHGEPNAYTNYGCRCDPCTDCVAQVRRDKINRQRAAQGKPPVKARGPNAARLTA